MEGWRIDQRESRYLLVGVGIAKVLKVGEGCPKGTLG